MLCRQQPLDQQAGDKNQFGLWIQVAGQFARSEFSGFGDESDVFLDVLRKLDALAVENHADFFTRASHRYPSAFPTAQSGVQAEMRDRFQVEQVSCK